MRKYMQTIPEAASILECSIPFIYRLISIGKLRCVNGYISMQDLLVYKKIRKKNE